MKLKLTGVVGVAFAAVFSAGCIGPGLSHHVKQPAQVAIDPATDAELARAIGVTTLSSETIVLPSRLEGDPWAADPAPAPATSTWGADTQSSAAAEEASLPATRN